MLNQSYGVYITPLVINSLGGGHTQANTHTDDPHRINFKKPGAPTCGQRTPGLTNKTSYQLYINDLITPISDIEHNRFITNLKNFGP